MIQPVDFARIEDRFPVRWIRIYVKNSLHVCALLTIGVSHVKLNSREFPRFAQVDGLSLTEALAAVDWGARTTSMTPKRIWASANELSDFLLQQLRSAFCPFDLPLRLPKNRVPKLDDAGKSAKSLPQSPRLESLRTTPTLAGFRKFQHQIGRIDHRRVFGRVT